MNVTLEKSSATNASLKVALSPADYQSKVDKKIKEYSQKAVMKGFRPGKVPTGLVQKLYGKGILVEEINHMLSHALNDYIRNNKLPVVGDPLPSQSQNEIDFDTQKEFEFEYDLGLASEFNIDFDSLPAVTSYSIQATDEEINKTIEDLKVRFGEHNHVEEVALFALAQGSFGDLAGGDGGQCANAGEQAGPHEALDEFIVHRGGGVNHVHPAGRDSRTARPSQITSATMRLASSQSASLRGSTPKIQPVRTCSIAP